MHDPLSTYIYDIYRSKGIKCHLPAIFLLFSSLIRGDIPSPLPPLCFQPFLLKSLNQLFFLPLKYIYRSKHNIKPI